MRSIWILIIGAVIFLPTPQVLSAALCVGEPLQIIAKAPDDRSQTNALLAHDGDKRYLLVWQQGKNYYQGLSGDIHGIILGADGRPETDQSFVICDAEGSQESPRVAYAGGMYFVVWQDLRNGLDWDVYGLFVDADGQRLYDREILIAGGKMSQALPDVAAHGDNFIVVWQHFGKKNFYKLHAATFNNRGKKLASSELVHDNTPLFGGFPAVASLNEHCLLSWNNEKDWENSSIWGRMTGRFAVMLISGEGKPTITEVKRSPNPYLKGGGSFAVHVNKASALYHVWDYGKRRQTVGAAAIFGPEGAIPMDNPNSELSRGLSGWKTDKMISINTKEKLVASPLAASYSRGGYLVVACGIDHKEASSYEILGVRIDSHGKKKDNGSNSLLYRSPNIVANPTLAAHPKGWLMAWQEETTPGTHRLKSVIIKEDCRD